MSLLKFNFGHNTSPPDRMRHTHSDGHVSVADEKDLWLRIIAKHERDANRELPEGWEAAAEDRLCKLLPPGLCKYEDGTNPAEYLNTRIDGDTVRRGTQVLLDIATSDDPLVDQATAESRARICAGCPANVAVQGCSSCAGIADLVVRLKGGKKTQADQVLKYCAACGCSSRANVWVKPELLANGVGPEQVRKLKLFDHCWKWRELEALQNSEQPA